MLDELVAQYPNYEPAWYWLGQVTHAPVKKEKYLHQALKPDALDASYHLAEFLAEKKNETS